MGIGLSIGLLLKVDGLKFIMLFVVGGIGIFVKIDFSMFGWFDLVKVLNNLIIVYFVVIGVYFVI